MERGGVMDAGRGPAALCQHLHASFQTSHCAAICLPATHTHTYREEICEIISVSWHWINIWGWNLSVEKSPAGKYDWMRSRPHRNVICMSSKWDLPPMLGRSKGVRLVGWHKLDRWLAERSNNGKWTAAQPSAPSVSCRTALSWLLYRCPQFDKNKEQTQTQSRHPTFKDRQILAGSCCF